MGSNKTVGVFIEKQSHWKEALVHLRKLLLETDLAETIKWRIPVYTINQKNVVGLSAFKAYVGLWFFQGSFLSDPNNALVNAQDGKTKGMRQLRFSSLEDIDDELIRLYIAEAIQNQKEGKEIKLERKKEVIIPAELHQKLDHDQNLKESFESLTPGKQRHYCEYIESAKQGKTRLSRLDKIIPMINTGIGLNEKYKAVNSHEP